MTIGKVVPDAPKDDGLQKGKIMNDFLILIPHPSFLQSLLTYIHRRLQLPHSLVR